VRLSGRTPTSSRFLALAVVFALGASGCARDGRDLAEAQDWQTTTTRPLPPTSAPPQELGVDGLELLSSDFAPGDPTPIDATCAGQNVSPALTWSGVPDDAGELAVALIDQTNPDDPLLLWLMVGIEPSVSGLDSSQLPTGGREVLNDYGQPGWGNPCLETIANGTRDLQFRLYVLDIPSGVQAGAPGNEAWDIITASAVDSATLLMRIEAAV
jgi:phosphatidylethanolamine-binding protein (PEBP) family uncharacterized protein